jgi:cryptochrome 1
MTSSRVRVEEEETSSVRNSAGDSRAEVPTNANAQQNAREAVNQGVLQNGNRNTRQRHNNNNNTTTTFWLRNAAEDSTAESSSSTRRERDGGVVPEWSPPSSNFSDQFVDDENGIGATSPYLQRHPQSHQLMSWTRLPQTG